MKRIDELDRKILNIVKDNARIPYLEVARICQVSGAAIHQRMNKLQSMGVIKGSRLIVNTNTMGYTTCAYIGIALRNTTKPSHITDSLNAIKEITECHFTTGRYAILLKVYAQSSEHLLSIIQDKILSVEGIAGTETLVSLSEVFNRQVDFSK